MTSGHSLWDAPQAAPTELLTSPAPAPPSSPPPERSAPPRSPGLSPNAGGSSWAGPSFSPRAAHRQSHGSGPRPPAAARTPPLQEPPHGVWLSLLPQAARQPEQPPKTELGACQPPSSSPRAGSSPSFKPRVKCHLLQEAAPRPRATGASVRVPPRGRLTPILPAVCSAPPDATARPRTERTLRARLAQTASRPFPEPGEADSPLPGAASGPRSTQGPALRAGAAASAASSLPAVGGKSVTCGACALRGPGKSVQQPCRHGLRRI